MKERLATCGACGTERPVTAFMRRDRHQQYKARPHKDTDSFYCGCQNDPDDDYPPPSSLL